MPNLKLDPLLFVDMLSGKPVDLRLEFDEILFERKREKVVVTFLFQSRRIGSLTLEASFPVGSSVSIPGLKGFYPIQISN